MTTLDLRGRPANVDATVGNKVVIVLDGTGTGIDWTDYTLDADVLRRGDVIGTNGEFAPAVSGGNKILTLTLTSAKTTALGAGKFSWRLQDTVTEQPLVAGDFRLWGQGEPAKTSTTTIPVTIGDSTVSMSIVVGATDAFVAALLDSATATRTALDSRYVQKSADDRMFIPATGFVLETGSPTLVFRGNSAAWSLDGAGAQERVTSGLWMPPQHWSTFSVYLWGANAGAGSGDVRMGCFGRKYAVGDSIADLTSLFGSASLTAFTAGAQNILQRITVATGVTATADTPFSVQVRRSSADAADTLANDYGFFGLEIVRAS